MVYSPIRPANFNVLRVMLENDYTHAQMAFWGLESVLKEIVVFESMTLCGKLFYLSITLLEKVTAQIQISSFQSDRGW